MWRNIARIFFFQTYIYLSISRMSEWEKEESGNSLKIINHKNRGSHRINMTGSIASGDQEHTAGARDRQAVKVNTRQAGAMAPTWMASSRWWGWYEPWKPTPRRFAAAAPPPRRCPRPESPAQKRFLWSGNWRRDTRKESVARVIERANFSLCTCCVCACYYYTLGRKLHLCVIYFPRAESR